MRNITTNTKIVSIAVVIMVAIATMYIVNQHLLALKCEIHKCPFCYGINFCKSFNSSFLRLYHRNLPDLFQNYFSVKNVYFGLFMGKEVVMKKLGHNSELGKLDATICRDHNLKPGCDLQIYNNWNYFDRCIDFLMRPIKRYNTFRVCSNPKKFLINLWKTRPFSISKNFYFRNVWTMLQLNAEPLLLQLFNKEKHWPVAHLYGSCGRMIVEERYGEPLNTFEYDLWLTRAYLSLQLLEAANNFTFKHRDHRFYLTDLSPDNIVVNRKTVRLAFIDLEDVIITSKDDHYTKTHYTDISLNSDNHSFAFSEIEICESTLSDHNFYATCKLLLSASAPWPMMENGLLHSPPEYIKTDFPQLFVLIEQCVDPPKGKNRFDVALKIMELLIDILKLL